VLAAVGLLRGDQRGDNAPRDSDAAAELAGSRRGADDDTEPASADVPAAGGHVNTRSSSRHSSQNASGAAMPASAATTGRIAASLRAAIACSAEVSVSTIHSRADVASAPSASPGQWPPSCRGSDQDRVILDYPHNDLRRRGPGAQHHPDHDPGAPRSLERADENAMLASAG
jgi:hypothetical protein